MFDTMDGPTPVAARPQMGHRRNKSSTSVLKAIITSKSLSKGTKGKENTTPPQTANSNATPIRTPIWAEFASTGPQQSSGSSKIPLNDRSVDQEMNLYSPHDYSPSKQRNYHDFQRPVLMKKDRPKSECLPKSKSSVSVFEAFTRTNSNDSGKVKPMDTGKSGKDKSSKTTKIPLKGESGAERAAKATRSASRDLLTMAKKGGRVMGLVAAFNGKSDATECELDPKQVDAQFEAVLVCAGDSDNVIQF
jgi:hypothetical protein